MSEIFTRYIKKKMGVLTSNSKAEASKYEDFINQLPEGTELIQYTEVIHLDNTLAQLAKVHKCIRTLASYNGSSFKDMKREIKRLSGMYIETPNGNFEVSFSKVSREDLNLAIQACIELGDEMEINLR